MPVFKNYKSWLAEQGHDTTYLFPTSNAGQSGTTKIKLPHVSDKSINSWLAKVRNEAGALYGEKIRPFASHTYRHTLAARFLYTGATFEDVARILGDTVATIEAHYSDLGFSPSFRRAWENAHTRSKMKTTEGTAQPEWLDRFRKVRTPNQRRDGLHASRGTDSRLVADVPVSAPQTQVAQLQATIRSAHALLQAGLIGNATSLLAAFSPEVQPRIDRELTKVRSDLDRTCECPRPSSCNRQEFHQLFGPLQFGFIIINSNMTEIYVPPLTNLPYRKIGLSYADSQFAAVPTQQVFIEEMKQSFRYFFSAEENSFQNDFPNQVNSTNFPFKGFLLSGKPGVGKTEAVIEACRALAGPLDDAGIELELLHISSQSIFRSAVGEMESRLARVFEDAQDSTNHRKRTVLLFDDIDTMLVKRTEENPSEWSRSLNGVFFHHCDRMIASKVLIVATTNVPEKIDDAIHSRLFMRPVPEPTVEELVSVAANVLPLNPKGFDKKEMLDAIEAEIRSSVNDGETASFRLARKIAIIEIVNGVLFR